MAFNCGFYNAVNHDRTYDATQFGDLFTGLINDGVYATVGHAMTVAPVYGMTVKVRSGRAWFNKTWNVNDSDYPLTIPESDLLLPRIDAVILEVDTRLAVRNNSLKVVKGGAANNPVYPELVRANGLYQYPLAYVNVRANVTSIKAEDIEVVVGRNPTPFVTGIVSVADISDFWSQWDSEFHTWFDDLRTNMSGDVAQNLQAQIEELKVSMITDDTKATTSQAQSGTSDSTWMTPAKTLAFYKYRLASLSDVQKDSATENTHIVTPVRLQNYMDFHKWDANTQVFKRSEWVSSYDLSTYFMGRAATNDEVSAGGIDWKYVSPLTLKTALASFSPSGGSSSGTAGSGTISAADGISLATDISGVRYFNFGPITLMNYTFEFSKTSSDDSPYHAVFFIRGLPAPTTQFMDQGILTTSSETLWYRLLCTPDSTNTEIQAVIEFHGNGSSTSFEIGKTYSVTGSVVYY